MQILPDWLKAGYLRLIEPVAEQLVRCDVHPNTITTVGTLCTIAGGVLYAVGHIRLGGWLLGVTALFDVLDGMVARRTERSSVFGAFYDSTLDRVADGFVLGGLAVFFATRSEWWGVPMVGVCVAGLVGSYLTSYTRARAEALGIDARVGILQRPERVVLLSAPQALFGLAFHGLVLIAIIVLLTVTAWITAAQRVRAVYRGLQTEPEVPARALHDTTRVRPLGARSRRRIIAKGE
ncbi:MAG: CDP-alcohol phosphatidyltransferase family protein [Gemmatimonadaceae bacterium]